MHNGGQRETLAESIVSIIMGNEVTERNLLIIKDYELRLQ
jgi:hypothetical protein